MAERVVSSTPKMSSVGVRAASLDSQESTEKEELISHILELQNTLHDLSQRVNSVKEENSRLKSENQVLNKYIENLMVTSGIFKSTSRKWRLAVVLVAREIIGIDELASGRGVFDKQFMATWSVWTLYFTVSLNR